MSLGEDVPGEELLRLPAIGRAPPSLRGQLTEMLDYCAADLPELFIYAGALVGGESKQAIDMIATELILYAPVGELPEVVRIIAWTVGCEVDMTARLHSGRN